MHVYTLLANVIDQGLLFIVIPQYNYVCKLKLSNYPILPLALGKPYKPSLHAEAISSHDDAVGQNTSSDKCGDGAISSRYTVCDKDGMHLYL